MGVLLSARGRFESKCPLEAELGAAFYVRHKGVLKVNAHLRRSWVGRFTFGTTRSETPPSLLKFHGAGLSRMDVTIISF